VCNTALFPESRFTHNYHRKVCRAMQKTTIDEKKTRDQLKAKRDLLLEEYSKNPMNTRLAIEIRLIDDQVAALTERLVEQRKSGLD
jgi:hypothetical protein